MFHSLGGVYGILASVDVDSNGDEEDGNEAKEDDGVNKNGNPTCLHIMKLHHSFIPRQLKQQPWTQHHKQHHRYHHRPPIRHCIFFHTLFTTEIESYIETTEIVCLYI